MLDSGANVTVVPLVKGMTSERTMCSLVRDNKAKALAFIRKSDDIWW